MEVSEAMAAAKQDDDIEPLSGQPFFHVKLTKSHVGARRVYQMVNHLCFLFIQSFLIN